MVNNVADDDNLKISPSGRNDARRIVGILLAAGNSTRFGSNKLLQPLPNFIPMVVQAAQNMLTAIPESCVIVRPDDLPVKSLLANLPIQLVDNPEAMLGMSSSIVCGVSNSYDAAGWIIALADMPFIPARVYVHVRHELQQGADIVTPYYQGERGHPVGFSAKLRDELLQLHGDRGARDLLAKHASLIRRIDVDTPAILADIDELSDLKSTKIKMLS